MHIKPFHFMHIIQMDHPLQSPQRLTINNIFISLRNHFTGKRPSHPCIIRAVSTANHVDSSHAVGSSIERLTITQPDDWHLHLRDGPGLASVAPHRCVSDPNVDSGSGVGSRVQVPGSSPYSYSNGVEGQHAISGKVCLIIP